MINVWYKRTVEERKRYAYVKLPKKLAGQEVYVITDRDADELKELVEVTLIHRKAYQQAQNELKERLDLLEKELRERITKLEQIVYGSSERDLRLLREFGGVDYGKKK